jgi:hypothetical protein
MQAIPNHASSAELLVLRNPEAYRATTGNSIHHNTIIFDSGANGDVGFLQKDPANQPDFFAKNTPPDYNSYHLSKGSAAQFLYDNDSSSSNKRKTFAGHQAARADVHGHADTNNTSGFPSVRITSPPDESSIAGPVTVKATASDQSGIKKVEFFPLAASCRR